MSGEQDERVDTSNSSEAESPPPRFSRGATGTNNPSRKFPHYQRLPQFVLGLERKGKGRENFSKRSADYELKGPTEKVMKLKEPKHVPNDDCNFRALVFLIQNKARHGFPRFEHVFYTHHDRLDVDAEGSLSTEDALYSTTRWGYTGGIRKKGGPTSVKDVEDDDMHIRQVVWRTSLFRCDQGISIDNPKELEGKFVEEIGDQILRFSTPRIHLETNKDNNIYHYFALFVVDSPTAPVPSENDEPV
ncbi:hypothetical protein L218DRAFT_1082371 [Marasmius fiardii PR-910]|nr:hypothetical protein L218DRAFT_1082371 [Marasmius fiardii PR-910]